MSKGIEVMKRECPESTKLSGHQRLGASAARLSLAGLLSSRARLCFAERSSKVGCGRSRIRMMVFRKKESIMQDRSCTNRFWGSLRRGAWIAWN